MESSGCHQQTQRGGLSVCAWRGLQNLAVQSHFEVSHMAPVLWTLYAPSDAETLYSFPFFSFLYQREEKNMTENLSLKKVSRLQIKCSAPRARFWRLTASRSFSFLFFSFLPEPERITGELMKRGLPWTFWCSMRWQSHMKKRKMPGWRWCFSILNMMERQSELRIWHRQRKSNLLTVAVLNKCQSENAASLFKSIRGLGLTVSGGRSPFLWGWRDFFFFLLTKVLSILIRWHRYKQLSLSPQ